MQGNLSAPTDTHLDISNRREIQTPPSPLGAGYLILVARELTGLSQRRLARAIATSQPALARLETGNRLPTIRTLLRVAGAAGVDLVVGLRRPGFEPPDPTVLERQGFALIGTLHLNPEDALADFVVLREPTPFEGPRDD
jgi:transcriptional regulator with XRE-family HTH domain